MYAVPSAEASPTKAQMKQNTDGRTTPGQEPFDYSAVPNILDDILTPEHDATSRKKKKHKQNAGEPCAHFTFLLIGRLLISRRWYLGAWQLSCTAESSTGA
jgi:hypothetical protein